MADLEALVAKTQEMIGAIITRPSMSTKHLSRPPFRFIHDTFMSLNKTTGFIEGLFSGTELNAKEIGDRADKVAFLQKMLTFVFHATGEEVQCKPTKVVAGQEADATNIFLQAVATVAASGDRENCARAVRLTLGQAEPDGEGKASTQDEQKSVETRDEPVHSQQRRDSNASTASTGSTGAPTTVSIPGVDGNWETTANLFEPLITRPRMTEKHLCKPPFRFLHDVVTQTMRKVPGFLEGIFEDHELDSKQITDRAGKIAYLNKLGEYVAHQFQSNIPCRPAKVVAGLEHENTNRLLQMVAILAIKTLEGGDESNATEEKNEGSNEETKNSTEDKPVTIVSKAAAQEEDAPQKQQQGTTESKEEPPVETKDDDAARKTARPATARKRPPKIKNTVEEIENKPGGGGGDGRSEMPAGVMVEGADSDSEADDDDGILNGENVIGVTSRDRSGSLSGDSGPKGKLLRGILDEEGKESESKEPGPGETKISENGVNLGSIGNSLRKSRGGKAGSSAVDIDNLRKAIQLLCQSTNPLGKCMDYVNEDMTIMGKELEKWRAEYHKHCDTLEEEERKTKEDVLPLVQKLRESEEEMKDQASKITLLKAKIAKNELRIQEQMRRMITG